MRVFIADLHLLPDGDKSQLFIKFCQQTQAKQLYILGDLFEVWLGDKTSIPHYQSILKALKKLSHQCQIFLIVGNRDFLLSSQFEQYSNVKIIAEPYQININQQNYLLTHGDIFCTDDIAYQRFKYIIRHPICIKILHLLPSILLHRLGRFLRKRSGHTTQQKNLSMMDVNQKTVDDFMECYPDTHLIHGHTHRQNIHNHTGYQRFVLGDWHNNKGNALVVEQQKIPYFIDIL